MIALAPNQGRAISAAAMPLFQKIRAGHKNIHYFSYYLEYLALHMPENLLVPGLAWLDRNGLRGDKFLEFIIDDCKRSGLELIRQLTMRLEHEKKLRVLTARDVQ